MIQQAVIESIMGTAVPIEGDDIDTDRIIPARFLKEISFENMGAYLFYDERYDRNNIKKSHPLNEPRFEHATILVVGNNFGCGSSREHAPQSIKRYGIQAIIGESFSEIFAGNAKAIGMPVVTATKAEITALTDSVKKNSKLQITLNLVSKRVRYGEESFLINMPDPQRESFLKGTWNVLELLKSHVNEVQDTAKQLPYISGFNAR